VIASSPFALRKDVKKDAKVTVTETDGKVTTVEAKNP
jgi:hypothetical protein